MKYLLFFFGAALSEASIIIREHTPLTNLFMCLWFNEVVRFTSRDQLSFPYIFWRLNGPMGFNMFPVCTRKDLVNNMGHIRKAKPLITWFVHSILFTSYSWMLIEVDSRRRPVSIASANWWIGVQIWNWYITMAFIFELAWHFGGPSFKHLMYNSFFQKSMVLVSVKLKMSRITQRYV